MVEPYTRAFPSTKARMAFPVPYSTRMCDRVSWPETRAFLGGAKDPLHLADLRLGDENGAAFGVEDRLVPRVPVRIERRK